MRNVAFTPEAFIEYNDWAFNNRDIFTKIQGLIKDIQRAPFKGLGKPEPLKGKYKGNWSRRITDEHRLIYYLENDSVIIIKCNGHYE